MNFLYPQIALALLLTYAGFEGFPSRGFYSLLRIITFLLCGLIAYQNYQKKDYKWAWTFGVIALFFNPVFKLDFRRSEWETIDQVSAIILGIYTYLQYKNIKKIKNIPTLEETIIDLFKRDAESISKGIIPEKNLTPFDDIKREIILLGYHRDFYNMSDSLQKECKEHFESEIFKIKRLDVPELENLLKNRKLFRDDLAELEKTVRKDGFYRIVPPIYITEEEKNSLK